MARHCAERTLHDVENERASALPRLYERITSHKPTTVERAILEQGLDELLRYYRDQTTLAQAMVPGATDAVHTAAWTLLAQSLLNLESAKVRR